MEADEGLEAEARKFRASGALGRSPPLIALFDYLLTASLEGRAPKEDEIATEVFNRDPGFDRGQDSVVRVYAHRLRGKLEGAYAQGGADACRLELPRGEYRLRIGTSANLAESGAASVSAKPLHERWPSLSGVKLVGALLVVALLSAMATGAVVRWSERPNEAVAAARTNVLWGSLIENGLPTLVVVGDYYMIGESDDGMNVSRLVREFDVNGPADLDALYLTDPANISRYTDVGIRYLPRATAPALGRVMPVLGQMNSTYGLSVILASELTSANIKANNIVYVGYFSGMGTALQNLRSISRFEIGASYDEVVDRGTHRRYVSLAGMTGTDGTASDYGLISVFRGPAGNVFVMIAGTRDSAVQQMSEIATSGTLLAEAWRKAGSPDAFEALYEVSVMGETDVTGRLIAASPIDSPSIWQASIAAAAPASIP